MPRLAIQESFSWNWKPARAGLELGDQVDGQRKVKMLVTSAVAL